MIAHLRRITVFLTTAASIALCGCAPKGSDLPVLPETSSIDASYILGPGDQLHIALYGVNQMNERTGAPIDGTGQYTVADDGTVEAPLIGPVAASGLTIDQFKHEITLKFADGYLKDPKVGVDITAYRPFFIVGEVNHPGSYPCTARSRVLSAVATAGGYTYRANEDFVVVERREGDKIITGRVGPDSTILPDDVIRVTQRYY